MTNLDSLPPRDLATALVTPNGTVRDTVQRLLIHRADPSAAPVLADLARTSKIPECRTQALATLDGLGALDPAILLPSLSDPHPGARREAVRLAEPRLAADRDPRMVERPDDFDPDRPAKHLAFGHGMHRCLGAELARMELRIALRELVCRFPDLTPAGDDLGWRQLSIVYGIDRLPVRLGAPVMS